ncbi:MAG: hypothetical protein ABR505_12400 [Actinomycetota bacterium]
MPNREVMFRYSVALACSILLLATPVVGQPRGKRQVVEGAITFMAPAPPQPQSCFPGITRNLTILTGDQFNGVFGYVFDVDRRTWGKGFRVEPTSAALQADLDMSFYTELGQPYPAAAPETVVYETRAPGGEAGEVPEKMTKAIVCMYTGHDAEFKYTAGAGIPIPQEPDSPFIGM